MEPPAEPSHTPSLSPQGDPGLQYRADPRTFLATTLQGIQKQLSELSEALLPTQKEREGSRRQSEQWKPGGKNWVKPEPLPKKQMVLGKLVTEKNGNEKGGSYEPCKGGPQLEKASWKE